MVQPNDTATFRSPLPQMALAALLALFATGWSVAQRAGQPASGDTPGEQRETTGGTVVGVPPGAGATTAGPEGGAALGADGRRAALASSHDPILQNNSVVSPDGAWVSCGSYCWPTAGNGFTALPPPAGRGILGKVWAPDSHALCSMVRVHHLDAQLLFGNPRTACEGNLITFWSPTAGVLKQTFLDALRAWRGWEPVTLVGWTADSKEVIVLVQQTRNLAVVPLPPRVTRLVALREGTDSARLLLEWPVGEGDLFGPPVHPFSASGQQLALLWRSNVRPPPDPGGAGTSPDRLLLVNLADPASNRAIPWPGDMVAGDTACWVPDDSGLVLLIHTGDRTRQRQLVTCSLAGTCSPLTLDWEHLSTSQLKMSPDGHWLFGGTWVMDATAPMATAWPNVLPTTPGPLAIPAPLPGVVRGGGEAIRGVGGPGGPRICSGPSRQTASGCYT